MHTLTKLLRLFSYYCENYFKLIPRLNENSQKKHEMQQLPRLK